MASSATRPETVFARTTGDQIPASPLVETAPPFGFTCWHYLDRIRAMLPHSGHPVPCINKRNRAEADSAGKARNNTNSTGSEHFGQKGKTRPFRSVISRCAECTWKKP